MNAPVTRYALALDLVDNETLIAEYIRAHESIWQEVREHLFSQGVLAMEIYRLGTRMFMVMDVDPEVYSDSKMARASMENEAVVRWEALMWTYQSPTPWTPSGQKWVPMQKVFELR